MLFKSEGGGEVRAAVCPQRARRLTDVHGRKRRNALWLYATTKGLHDPIQNRVRCYSVGDLAALWGVTSKSVRNGIRDALRDHERLKADDAG